MPEYTKCLECNNFHFTDQKCKPEFRVFHDDFLGENGKFMRGWDTEEAALAYAEYYNGQMDQALMDDPIIIEVVNEYGEREKFKISAEVTIDYSATQL